MASEGLWNTVCDTAQAAADSIKQLLTPTKSQTEIQLQQNLREAKVGDELSSQLEKLASHDESKVAQGFQLLSKLKSGNFASQQQADTNKNGKG